MRSNPRSLQAEPLFGDKLILLGTRDGPKDAFSGGQGPSLLFISRQGDSSLIDFIYYVNEASYEGDSSITYLTDTVSDVDDTSVALVALVALERL